MLRGTFEPAPFANGRSRQAHKGVFTAPPDKAGREVVVKKPVNGSYATLLPKMEMDIKVAKKAMEYAEMFNSASRTSTPINFQQPIKMETIDEKQEPVLVEYYLYGRYTKWFSNNGTIDYQEIAGNEILTAFAHWTWVKSQKQLVVCDLQGVKGNPSGYHLTDPAINSVAQEYGSTDLGKRGIDLFFQTHTCSSACVSLGIQNNKPKQTTANMEALLALIGNQLGTTYSGELPQLLDLPRFSGHVLPTLQRQHQRRQNRRMPYCGFGKPMTTYRY